MNESNQNQDPSSSEIPERGRSATSDRTGGLPKRESESVGMDKDQEDINALSGNKVGVEIEPDVKANRVVVQMCSCSIVWNCFSYPG